MLILGGTAEARALAAALVTAGVDTLSSLAGRVADPTLPAGRVRIGGFGGVEGLASFLARDRVRVLVDATHPFATTISTHAVAAADLAGVPLLQLARPGWADHPDAAGWNWVPDHDAAALAAARLGRRPMLTTGRQTLPSYLALPAALVRLVEPADAAVPPGWTVVLDRGPYTAAGELTLMRAQRVDVLVTKDSGGSYTSAKLDAARALALPVVVVARPAAAASSGSATAVVADVGAAAAWVRGIL